MSTVVERFVSLFVLGLVCQVSVLHAQTTGTGQSQFAVAPLPFGISSFGAIGVGQNIYVYGGHIGPPHTYTLDGMSGKLLSCDTGNKNSEWKVVSTGTPLQGSALVAHNGRLIRIGGLTIEQTDKSVKTESAKDLETEATEDSTAVASGTSLRSLSSVESFNPETGEWTKMPELPEPRSSHDAVVLRDHVYVVGGWTLDGEEGNEDWLETAYRLDLSAEPMKWEAIASPKQDRRAHSLSVLHGKVVLIGGMSADGDVLNDVEVYDSKANSWNPGPSIPSDARFASFGNSSFSVGGQVYCLAIDGVLRKLDADKSMWAEVKKTTPRFFHRLVKLGEDRLAIVGGSNMDTGFIKDIEIVDINASESKSTETSVKSGSLEEQLGRLKSSMPEDYPELIKAIATENTDVKSLVKSIREGVGSQPNTSRTSKLTKGWSEWEATDEYGTTRPYQVYIPESLKAGGKPQALVVHIHGAVGKPEFGTGAGSPSAVGYAGFLWPKVADKHGLVVVCPVGRNECAWWTDNGVSHVNAVIRDLKRTLDFPDRSIFCTGFSDGASGCYYMAMANPGPFAGFLAMNGHPEVANASGKQLYLHNMAATPFIAAMTQEDSLYPSRSVLPHITEAIRQGAPVHVISYPNANHQPVYFDDQTVTFVNFFTKTQRNDERKRVRWLTSDVKIGSVGWAEILELGKTDHDVDAPGETMVMTTPGRVSLGVQMTPTGNSVAKVVDNSVALKTGIQDGDKIVELDGVRIANTRALRTVLRKKTYGDEFTCEIERDGERESLRGKFPEFSPKPSYSRKQETSFIECEIIEGHSPLIKLKSRNVKRLRVWMPDSMAGLDSVKVLRSKQATEVRVKHLSAVELLERFANNPDSGIRSSYIEIE